MKSLSTLIVVRIFTTDEDLSMMKENCSHHVPHKHELISCLGVGGRWVTSRCDLQVIIIETSHDPVIYDVIIPPYTNNVNCATLIGQSQ